MQEGQLHGRATLYAEGRVLAEIAYVHGLRDGDMRSYGEFGQLASVVGHADDLPHGAARYFHPDGATVARSAVYQQGRLHGEVRDYSPDGTLLSSTQYAEGKPLAAVGQAAGAPVAAASASPDGRKSWLSRLVEG